MSFYLVRELVELDERFAVDYGDAVVVVFVFVHLDVKTVAVFGAVSHFLVKTLDVSAVFGDQVSMVLCIYNT